MIKTDKAIMHISMRRSGCNAISRFIYNLYDVPKAMIEGRACWICKGEGNKKKRENNPQFQPIFYNPYESCIDGHIDIGRQDHMKLIFLRQEDITINGYYFKPDNILHWNNSVGKCEDFTYVISMRDPFNMLASIFNQRVLSRDIEKIVYKFKKTGKIVLNKKIKSRIKKWIQHAREFTGRTNYLPPDKVLISYNKWFVDEEYRRKIASDLDVDFIINNWYLLTPEGGGSSFSKTKIIDVRKLKVFDRWKTCLNNEVHFEIMKALFSNEELVNLSHEIFGHIEGTEIFYK